MAAVRPSTRTLVVIFVAIAVAAAPWAPRTAAAESPRTVAVLPMAKGAGGPELDGFGAALADMMVTDLSTVPGLLLVERQRLADLAAELELGESDFVDPASAAQLGHGLGAQLVVVGTFTALEGQLVIDTRLVEVETGAVIKAARSEGAVAEFVGIEKDVIERLVDGLEVQLSMSERRVLLLQTPTEDFEAFASYGRGVKAKQDGEIETARAAFEEAIRRDPDFALAATELAALAARTEQAQTSERERAADTRQSTMYRALEQLVPETARADGFRDTRESMIDLAIRLDLLRASDQDCARYDEMRHLLVRTGGDVPGWWDDLDPDPRRNYKEAEALMDARAVELGLVGPETWYGTRKGEAMHRGGTALGKGPKLLTARNLQPESFSDSIVHSLERCFPPRRARCSGSSSGASPRAGRSSRSRCTGSTREASAPSRTATRRSCTRRWSTPRPGGSTRPWCGRRTRSSLGTPRGTSTEVGFSAASRRSFGRARGTSAAPSSCSGCRGRRWREP